MVLVDLTFLCAVPRSGGLRLAVVVGICMTTGFAPGSKL